MGADFRHTLRAATADEHDAVDHLLSSIELTTVSGFGVFLQIHWACFSTMQRVAPLGSMAAAMLQEMLKRIDDDLTTLGKAAALTDPATLNVVEPLAMDYMIEGSRLGSKVLKRQWSSSRDMRVRRARAYFSMQPVEGRWRQVCNDLSEIPNDSARAALIINDVKQLFGLFHAVGHDALAPQKMKEPIS